MLTGLFAATFSAFAPSAMAVAVAGDPNGTLTGFEIDGNQVHQTLRDEEHPENDKIDWEDLVGAASLTVVTDDTLDTGLQGTSKENDPSGWLCNTGGDNPGKANILKAAVNVRTDGTGGPWIDLALVRESGEGDTHVNFEFNQNTITNPCPYTGRITGDLLVVADFPGGSGSASVEVYLWDSTITADGEWVLKNTFPANKAAAASNGAIDKTPNVITDYIFGLGTIDTREFAEASIDLSAVFGENPTSCVSFGDVNIRSRSSGESITSALQDRLPQTPIDLSTCGKIVVHKTDDAGTALEGATFGLWPAAATVPAIGAGGTRPSTDSVDTCTSIANGSCTFDDVNPGSYKVAEISPPTGYDIDPSVIDVTVASKATVNVTAPFVDPLDTGTVRVTKAVTDNGQPFAIAAADLNGLTFILEKNGSPVNTWPPPGSAAQCSLNGSSLSCDIGPVPLGSYTVTEDPLTLPSGISQGPDMPVTITADDQVVPVTITNPLNPINIALDKIGDKDQANVGDTVNYSFTVTTTGVRLHGVTLAEWEGVIGPVTYADICDSGPTFSNPLSSGYVDGYLDVGDSFVWTCPHLITGTDPDPLPNRAHAHGTDDFGRTADAYDTFTVDILYPDLQVVKLAADGIDAGSSPSSDETIDAPGTASYSIVVTNVGTGIARNATLTDTLPAGSWTVSLASPDGDDVCPVGGSPKTGSFTCTFGDLAAGASKTVTVSRTVTIANDCAAALLNSAGVTTTYQQVNIDPNSSNDSSSATIRVRCPDVGVVKEATNTPINAGDRAEWTITVTNHGAGTASGVHLEDEVSADLSDLQLSGTDAASCDLDGHTLTCDFGDIAGAGVRTFTVSGLTEPADCGTIPNTATVVNANGGIYQDTNLLNNTSSDDVVVQCPDVWVTKDGPAEVSAGDQITWTITFGNSGQGDAYNATLTDNLPAGLTGYQLNDPDGVCGLATSTVTCTFEVLAAGTSHSITVTGTTGTSPGSCGDVVNPASISADNEGTGLVRDNNFDSATTDVECPNIDLVKVADDPSTVSAGDPVGFSLTVTNAAGEDVGIARDVVVADTLPAIPGYVWSIDGTVPEDADCTLDGQDLTCSFGDLASGQVASVHLVANPDGETSLTSACGTYPNTADVTLGNGTEADDTNNSASVSILCPGLNLGKVADHEIVDAGDPLGFTITVSNIDDGQPPAEGIAKQVVVTDVLPGDVTWTVAADSDLPDGADCTIDAGVLTCELGDLAAIAAEDAPQVTIHLVAATTEADCAVYDNTASATVANGTDPDDASASSRVRCPISIGLDKVGTTIAHVGDTVTYDFTVTNTGGEDLVNVVLTDPKCTEGTLVQVDDGDGDAVLAAGEWDAESESFVGGEVWTYTCERTLASADVVIVDGQPVVLNVGSVRGEDADGRETTDTAPHSVLIITPAIQIVKTVDDATPAVGQTVTFTYVVTNTGDTTLFEVVVVDDQLGTIGTIPELAAGASATLTKTMVVAADSPTRNVATATGTDVLGKTVIAADDATITIVLAEVITQPAALPRTGADTRLLLLLSGLLLLVGGALLAWGEGWMLPATRRQD